MHDKKNFAMRWSKNYENHHVLIFIGSRVDVVFTPDNFDNVLWAVETAIVTNEFVERCCI